MFLKLVIKLKLDMSLWILESPFFYFDYMFTPWISLLLLESSPIVPPAALHYKILWWVFVVPVMMLDVKIYGQWFTKGKRFLSMVANPTSQMSVIGNLVAAQAAAQMGWKESALCFFALGIAHYLVLFVTLYQRLPGNNNIPAMLRPVFFLFFAAPSIASLAWHSICGTFDTSSKMLFFLSLFLFLSLVLSDDEKRSIYDRYGEAGLKGSGMGTGDFSNPFDLFETLFEGMGGGMGSRDSWNEVVDGEDEYYSLVLNFKEAVFGVEKEIEVRRLENCGTCNGSGAKPGTTSSRCSTCGGQGRVVLSTRTPLGIFQ